MHEVPGTVFVICENVRIFGEFVFFLHRSCGGQLFILPVSLDGAKTLIENVKFQDETDGEKVCKIGGGQGTGGGDG